MLPGFDLHHEGTSHTNVRVEPDVHLGCDHLRLDVTSGALEFFRLGVRACERSQLKSDVIVFSTLPWPNVSTCMSASERAASGNTQVAMSAHMQNTAVNIVHAYKC